MQYPFFYGWIIVAIAMVAGFISSGVSNVTMAVVLKPISEDLGWSRSVTAAAITLGSFGGGMLSPLFGPVADRFGPRVLLPLGGILVGLLSIGVSQSSAPWQFYATFIPARALTEFLLCGVVPYTAIANWFQSLMSVRREDFFDASEAARPLRPIVNQAPAARKPSFVKTALAVRRCC